MLPALIVVLFALALVAVSARIWLPGDMLARHRWGDAQRGCVYDPTMTDASGQQRDQGLANLSIDPDLLAQELAAEETADPLDSIDLDDAADDSGEAARISDED